MIWIGGLQFVSYKSLIEFIYNKIKLLKMDLKDLLNLDFNL